MSRLDGMAHNPLGSQPVPHLRSLPDGTSVSSDGSYYRLRGEGFADYYVPNMYMSGPLPMQGSIDLRFQDPFSQGAMATLPTGLRYVKRGNIWLLVPISGATSVNLSRQVPGLQEYRVIEQVPYVGGAPVATPLTISFNMPLSQVKMGDITGANDLAFPASVGELIKGKISIVIDIVTTPAGHGTLKSSSQVSVSPNITKGRLANIVVGEVDKAFAGSNNVVAFHNQVFVQDLSLKDIVLVDLVQMSKSTYQPTVALRLRA